MKRSNITTAARNAWALTSGRDVAPQQPTPSEVIAADNRRVLRRYLPSTAPTTANPTLLVPPLAAPASCYDLRPGCSLAEFLRDSGRPTYLVDYGRITHGDRHLGYEDWLYNIIPTAIRQTSEHAGGRPVDVVAWSLGGSMSLLTLAEHGDLPVRSLAAIATPIDYSRVDALVPIRRIARYTRGNLIPTITGALGGMPEPLVRTMFRMTGLQRELTKPAFIARNLNETDRLAHLQAVDRFMGQMPAYPGRLYEQMHRQLIVANNLASGRFELGDHTIELARVNVPVLAVAGSADVIAPPACVEAITGVLAGAPTVRFRARSRRPPRRPHRPVRATHHLAPPRVVPGRPRAQAGEQLDELAMSLGSTVCEPTEAPPVRR
jgi:poly[(R)-3-hydroxyalkanoate] polymerase subunit PhaC